MGNIEKKSKKIKKAKKIFKQVRKFRKNHQSNLNIFIVCMSIIMIWRGVWNLLDVYLFPNAPLLSNLISITIGIIILLIDDGKLGEISQEHHKMK